MPGIHRVLIYKLEIVTPDPGYSFALRQLSCAAALQEKQRAGFFKCS
jgi:hypothetical protein